MSNQIVPIQSFSVPLACKYGIELAILLQFFVNVISKHKLIKRNQKKGKTWNYCTQIELSAEFPFWSEDQIFRLIKKLVEMDVLVKDNFNKHATDRTNWYAFKDEEKWLNKDLNTIPRNRGKVDEESRDPFREIADCIPHSNTQSDTPLYKDIVYEEKTLPFEKKKKETMCASRRWKLTSEQIDTFEWLKSLGLDTEEKRLAFWSKKHSMERLKNVYRASIEKKPEHIGKYMYSLLEREAIVRNNNAQENTEFANFYKEQHGWLSLNIYQKYISFPFGVDVQQIDLNLNPIDFARILIEKHDNITTRY